MSRTIDLLEIKTEYYSATHSFFTLLTDNLETLNRYLKEFMESISDIIDVKNLEDTLKSLKNQNISSAHVSKFIFNILIFVSSLLKLEILFSTRLNKNISSKVHKIINDIKDIFY